MNEEIRPLCDAPEWPLPAVWKGEILLAQCGKKAFSGWPLEAVAPDGRMPPLRSYIGCTFSLGHGDPTLVVRFGYLRLSVFT